METKYQLLLDITDITEVVVVTPDDDGAKKFGELIAKRELLFTKMKVLDKELAKLDKETIKNGRKECSKILSDIETLRLKACALDKVNKSVAEKILDKLKVSVKSTKTQKGFHKAYQPLYTGDVGSRFDSKK